MSSLTRASGFAAAAFVALAVSGSLAAAGEQSQVVTAASRHEPGFTVIGQAELNLAPTDQCGLLRRAISRHVCRLQSGEDIGFGASR
jgi:hypothetical protein